MLSPLSRFLFGLTLFAAGSLIAVPVLQSAESAEWHHDFRQAQAEAQRLGRPLIVHFHASWCGPCRQMERVLHSPSVGQLLSKSFVGVKVDSDRYPEVSKQFNVQALPTDIIVDPFSGRAMVRSEGFRDLPNYLAMAGRVQSRFDQLNKIHVANSPSGGSTETPVPLPIDPDGLDRARPLGKDLAATVPDFVPNTDQDETERTRVELGASAPIVGLEGFSPVALNEQRKWLPGDPELRVVHKGIVFYVRDVQEKERFERDPVRYAPRLLGCDPVVLWETDRAVSGKTQFGAFFDDQLYLFVNRENRTRFKENAPKYVRTLHVFKLERAAETTLR